jgi:hypothetical protein
MLTQTLTEKGHTYEYLRTPNIITTKINSNIYKDITYANNITNELEYNDLVRLVKLPQTKSTLTRQYYFMIKKYILANLWNLTIHKITLTDVKTYYPKINKLLNYKLFNKYTSLNNNPTYPQLKTNNKIKYVLNILHLFNITHPEQFDYSIECGHTPQGRKLNKKNNPNIINQQSYTNIQTQLTPTLLSHDFRMTCDLNKLQPNTILTDREFLETLKYTIGEFGFTISIKQTVTTEYNNNKKISQRINSYFIDLDISIIELLNITSRDYIQDIIDEAIITDTEGDIDDDNEDLAFINTNNNTNTSDDEFTNDLSDCTLSDCDNTDNTDYNDDDDHENYNNIDIDF